MVRWLLVLIMVLSIVFGLLCILLLGTFTYALFKYSYFSKQNVKCVRGWPLVGSMFDMLFKRDTMPGLYKKFYNAYPSERFIGFYDFMGDPVYLIRDPELIKQIAITDFQHFINHRASVDERADSLFSRALFQMQGERWRNMRSTLSPAFTSSKMRVMLSLVSETAKNFSDNLLNMSAGNAKVYDLADLFSRYGSDSIASSVFGLEINSLQDRDNQFYKLGLDIANFNGFQALKIFGYSSFPRLMSISKRKFISDESTKFFCNLVHEIMSSREKNNVVRQDFINLLMEARKRNLQHTTQDDTTKKDIGVATGQESKFGKRKTITRDWHKDDFIAQTMIFFLGGFNTVKIGVSCLVHELACNPDIQRRLHDEITALLADRKATLLSYEAMQTMKYLDMVVSETLRRWSLGVTTDRKVNSPYVLEKYDGTKVQLNVGDSILFPIYAMHMDPKYFPNPEKFDPERFSDANKGSIPSGVYSPFGMGPRNCIGLRYALMEIKAIVVYLLVNFTIAKCAKTPDPLKLKKGLNIILESENGFWAELRPRLK